MTGSEEDETERAAKVCSGFAVFRSPPAVESWSLENVIRNLLERGEEGPYTVLKMSFYALKGHAPCWQSSAD